LDRASLVGADLGFAHLGVRLVEAEDEDDASLKADPAHPCFPLESCELDARDKVSDDTGVGALLLDTDLSGADLRRADLNGVVMLRGSLRRARLEGATVQGARLVDVAVESTVCPDGVRRTGGCTGLVNLPAGPERERALQRVTWLQSLPFPWD
jgi:uncharacterized protein YjbI with pentapeptide repeats